jgi:hypothetical protein
MLKLPQGQGYILDIEANGLLDKATKIHCVVALDLKTGKKLALYGEKLHLIPKLLNKADYLVGHNLLAYDIPLLKKLGYVESVPNIIDTLVLSQLLNPDREKHTDCGTSKPRSSQDKYTCIHWVFNNPKAEQVYIKLKAEQTARARMIGAHGLENWGYEVGRGKPDHEDWSTFSKEMLHRCSEDVSINKLAYDKMEEEWGDYDWGKAYKQCLKVASIISQQEENGWYLDKKKVERYLIGAYNYREYVDKELRKYFKPEYKFKRVNEKPFKSDGKPTAQVLKDLGHTDVGGKYSVLEVVPFNLNSNPMVKRQLLSMGWKPTTYTKPTVQNPEGSPKLTEDSYGSLPSGLGDLLKSRRVIKHRITCIMGWIDNCRPDGRVSGTIGGMTNTGRGKHRGIVNVPSRGLYGKHLRSMFSVPEGRILMGADAKGLEARMEGHYTFPFDNGAYAKELIEGDVHSHNAEVFGCTRDLAKGGKYCLTLTNSVSM